MKLSTHGIYEV